ncbi:MAG: hypothetical protein WCG95_00115 [bacterium]
MSDDDKPKLEIDIQKLQRLKDDLNYFSYNYLKIKTKNDGMQPFKFTNIQLDAHNKIEQRKRENKPCKIVLLKSRQVGMSTLTEARFFSNITFRRAKNAFVLADKEKSTQNIFSMTKRYYDNLPPALQIPTKKLSSDEMVFETDSSFRVGTAGSKSIGRSMTINYFHGSEVGFWQNADEIVSGMFQTIPESNESEVILESTANGTSGDGAFFYNIVQSGLDPKSDYMTLFYPWYQQHEYKRSIIEPIIWTDEELELKRIYNLTDEQLAWRRAKITNEFKGREKLFKQEYPSSIQEAFVTTSNALVPLNYIEAARNNFINSSNAPIVIGVDPARQGDRTVITVRQGRVILKFYRFDEMNEVRLAGIIARLINTLNPAKVFIDYGHGIGTYDILVSNGLGKYIEVVQFGSGAYDSAKYINKRAEMFDNVRDWFMQEGGVFIKDQEHIEEFVRDISLIPDLKISDSTGKFGLEKKDKIVKGTEISSTDFADSFALTFASAIPFTNSEFQNEIKIIKRNWQQIK